VGTHSIVLRIVWGSNLVIATDGNPANGITRHPAEHHAKSTNIGELAHRRHQCHLEFPSDREHVQRAMNTATHSFSVSQWGRSSPERDSIFSVDEARLEL